MAEGEERPSGGWGECDDENGKYPIGFRFKPTTEELVEFYLLPKLLGEPTVPNEFVIDASSYQCDPEILTEKFKESGVDDDTWYFLSPRYRKYPGGDRPVRRTADKRGRWKPSTGQSKPPEEEQEGAASTSHSKAKKKKAAASFSENTLAYYVGPTTDVETKTKWLMHELVVPETPDNGFHSHGKSAADDDEPRDDMLLNKYVACRIYKSPLKKWKEIEEAAAAEVPTSSQSSVAAPECVGEAVALAPSSRPAKRPAVERPATSGHTGAPSKGVSSVPQTTVFPGGRSAAPTTRGSGGGSSVRMPPIGAGSGSGAGAAGRHGPGLPARVHWPPVYNSMQGPVQLHQPPLVYGYGNQVAGVANANGQQAAPGQGPPVSRPRQPHRAAAAAAISQVHAMMRPPHLAAGQLAPLPSPRQQQPPPETDEAYRNQVYARLVAEMKLQKAQKESAARAGQQRVGQTASAQPACFNDQGGDRSVGLGAEAMVSRAQFPAPHHGGYPYSSSSNLPQRPQRQQSSSAAPAAVPAAVEKAPASENVPSNSNQSVPAGANEGSCKGDAATATIADNIVLHILRADHWTLMKN